METRRWLLLATIAAAACGGYSAPDSVVLGSSVYTQAAPGTTPGTIFDFKPLTYYYLDPMVEKWEDGTQKPSVAMDTAASQAITARMNQYGYQQVGAGQLAPPVTGTKADVGLKMAYINNSYSYYYSYCGSYWYGWYGCWPAWGYAGTYSTGTVIVVMVDLRSDPNIGEQPPPAIAQRPVLWVNANYAVLQGSAANIANLTTALNRAFDQSAYLDTH